MRSDFGTPPLAGENRALVEQRLKEAREPGVVRETLTIDWRGQPHHVEVINMPVKQLYYNPGTHRIRAQRSFDPLRDKTLDEAPWSDVGQDYLDYLLKSLPADPAKRDTGFDSLKQNLHDFKQNDPGLITREGVLVNGNTRRAALTELGVEHMRVGVLPESCTWQDVSAVELSLQLRVDFKREYSYINRLLTMDEQLALGRPIAEIAREFRSRISTCEQDVWILGTLRDLIARSRDGDLQLRLMDFEDAQEKLRELYRRYTKEAEASKENADLLKEMRLAAIVLNFSKTDVRLVEPEFRARYLDRRLPDSLKPPVPASAGSVNIPGINRTVKAEGTRVAEARALTDMLVKAKAVETAGDRVDASRIVAASAVISQAWDAFDDALKPAGKDARFRKRRQAAPDRINDACEDLEQCVTDLVLARASNSLDEEAFDEAVTQLRTVLGKLAVESARSIKIHGDGVSWLLDVTGTEPR